jgi:S1-C subfamily serine protease
MIIGMDEGPPRAKAPAITDMPPRSRRALAGLLRSVVKVICVADNPDYEQPWQTQGPDSSYGSGAVVQTARGLRVLTNAHCVANHVFVQVRRYGLAQKYVADVEAIGHECDLALLSIDDESFFQGLAPLVVGELPKLSDRVSVCGYPIGGERLSITQGIVSRIEDVRYAQTQRHLLAVQIDAAINSGNSGGPVFNREGKLAGVAFQALDEGAQIGYMIAPSVVQHFLEDVASGSYSGFPDLGIVTQTLESEAHRRYLRIPPRRKGGVWVTRVTQGSSSHGVIQAGDVVLSIGGTDVAADGTVVLRDSERLDFSYEVARRQVGERIDVSLWREGAEIDATLELKPPRYLVAEERFEVRPSYYVVAGLLFVPLTRDYLATWGEDWRTSAPRELVTLYDHGLPTKARREVVVLQKVLADSVNQGYHDFESVIVEAADGKKVRSLSHLVQIVESCQSEFLRFDAADGGRVVVDREKSLKRHKLVLRRFGVPHDRSEDLRADGGAKSRPPPTGRSQAPAADA